MSLSALAPGAPHIKGCSSKVLKIKIILELEHPYFVYSASGLFLLKLYSLPLSMIWKFCMFWTFVAAGVTDANLEGRLNGINVIVGRWIIMVILSVSWV